MKKILYIISAAMLALTACMQEKEQSLSPVQYPEGQVLVSVNVQLPEPDAATRAMGQVPTIESLYVAVFGSEGSFQNWIPATFEQIDDYQDHTSTAKYKVYLPITDKKRHIHFIANPPKDEHGDIIKPVFGDEDEFGGDEDFGEFDEPGEGALLREDDGGLDDLLGDLTDDIDNGDLDLD